MNNFLDTLKQLGPARLGIMGGIVIGLLMFFAFVSLRISAPESKLLYGDLSSIDSGAIAAKLEEYEIRYEVSSDGSRVLVQGDAVGRARMLLAQDGLPNGGSLGYEIFDKQSGFGTTNFVQNINQVRALEGELARTITSLDVIRSARVHLVLPQRELFSRETRISTGSVFLGIRPGASVERETVAAIQSIVAAAVPALQSMNVSIIDSNGTLLAKGESGGNGLHSLETEDLRQSYEAALTQKLEDQVGRVVGFGKVRVTVTADMNIDQVTTNEELFDPSSQVVRSAQTTEENTLEREPAPDDISVANNLPGIGGDLLATQQPSLENNRIEEVTNFEINRTVRQTTRGGGGLKRISVAVLVDGKYTEDAEGNQIYTPRSEEELDQISVLVRSAVGYDADRGDVVEVINMQFAQVDTNADIIDDRMLFGFEKSDLLDVAEIMTVAIMVILVVLLVLQPMVRRLMETESSPIDNSLETDLLAARPDNPALAAPEGMDGDGIEEEESLISIDGVQGKVKASSVKKVEEIVENYPTETVSVIRNWMTQES